MNETGPPGAPTQALTTNPDLHDPKRPSLVAERLRGTIGGLVGRVKRLRGPIVAIAAVGAVLSGLFGYWNVYRSVNDSPGQPKSPPAAGAPPLSIAVLPFTVVGGKTVDESLAQSLTNDVIGALANSARYASVASYGSVATYKGKPVDPRAAGRDLNVRYLAEGEIRQNGDKVIVAASMIDAATATQVWSDRLDTTTAQLGTPAVTRNLAHRFGGALRDSEIRQAQRAPGTKADAVSLWLRGNAKEDGTLAGLRAALKLYHEALQLDPNLVGALSDCAWDSGELIELDPQADRDQLVRAMDDFSHRAVVADPSDSGAWLVRARALSYQYRWNAALEALDESLRIDPDRTNTYWLRALFMGWMGRPQDALAELDKAAALDPRTADWGHMLRLRCRAYLVLGRYDDAIKLCERAAPLEDDYLDYLYLTAAYAQTGDMTNAAKAKAQLLNRNPGYTIARFRAVRASDANAYWEQVETHMIAGLRKAGVPEK